jgi:phosphatidylserine/phosphatidylglycerophosphate/cardiolipin synthase-like enzyme
MRFKSKTVDGFCVYAVSGVNTISFAIDASPAARNGLLGFTVERFDPEENHRSTMPGFKVFESIVPDPQPNQWVSTNDHPMQSLVWDDFTAKDGRTYEYTFRPVRGTPYQLDRTAAPIIIRVKTEPLYTKDDHDVFFNRGVASSQAYERKFGNVKPDKLKPKAKQVAAIQWLARDLDDAIVKFIESAGKKDTLLCCFYEFHYAPVVAALAAARKNVARLRIIIDAKQNGKQATTDKHGKPVKAREAFPRVANLKAIRKAGIPSSCVIERDANPSDIQHNKFMVILRGAKKTPSDVWTGSTNISEGGVTGQTNVGHWVHDGATAAAFKAYWDLLATNPGSAKADDKATAAAKKAAYRQAVAALGKAPAALSDIRKGTTTVFSPRSGLDVLNLYVDLVDTADDLACITLAFGVNAVFKDQLGDNTAQDHLTFLLLEKKDVPNKNAKTPFVAINARNNVYKAWGAYIKTAVYQWAKETNAKLLRLNSHVGYIHSKFLLRDPLGKDPIVVTGSANFSKASTNDNDENMLIIRGNQRVADIYFTEFNRLFNHYYFRSVTESTGGSPDESSRFLAETPKKWLDKYAPGKLKAKRLEVYTSMKGFTTA